MSALQRPTIRGGSVLVTGGAGFIGSHLVDLLSASGAARITVVDDLFLGRAENLAEARRSRPDVELVVADATSESALRDIVGRVRPDVVFALATIPLPASHIRPGWAVRTILALTEAIVELARGGELGTLVHCSSSEVYGSAVRVPMDEGHPLDSETPYAAAKAGADLIVRSYWETFGIDATIVRPFNAYGPRQNDRDYAGIVPITLRRLARGEEPLIFGDGEQTRDFTFVTDTAEGLLRAYLEPASRRRVINIGSGAEVTINDLVRTMCRLTGWTGPVRHVPERVADVRRHLADISVARELLGYSPRVGLEEGLARTVEWYRASSPA